MNNPYGIAVDGDENIYFTDTDNHKVRLVNSSGIITTFAGTGIAGSSGDGGLAVNARLLAPRGVAVDGRDGKVYFTDYGNSVVCVVDSAGNFSTFASRGHGYGGDEGLAINAYLSYPWGIAVDALAGKVYIADSGNGVVRVVNSAGIITTFAGTPTVQGYNNANGGPATSALFLSPTGVAVDASGNGSGKVYIADAGQSAVYVVNATGIITIYAGIPGAHAFAGDGGLAISAQLDYPTGLAIDFLGNVYIGDTWNNVVRMVTNGSGIITTFAGGGSYSSLGDGGPATSSSLSFDGGMAVDTKGNLFIADTFDNRIRKVSKSIDSLTSQTSTPSGQPSAQPSVVPSTVATSITQPTSQ